MSRLRIAIVVAVLLIFFAVGGYIIFTNKGPGPKDVTFDVTVTGGTSMKPSELQVHQNDTVTINMTSDIDGEAHLHGYDIPFDNTAGQVTTHTLKAVNTGDFQIEWESTSTPLGDLKVSP